MGECGIVRAGGSTAPPGGITSASWVITDLDSGDVLAAKDPHARERPASLIKSLLAIVVIRELRPDTKVRARYSRAHPTSAVSSTVSTSVAVEAPGLRFTMSRMGRTANRKGYSSLSRPIMPPTWDTQS